jgi:hypothetical protein
VEETAPLARTPAHWVISLPGLGTTSSSRRHARCPAVVASAEDASSQGEAHTWRRSSSTSRGCNRSPRPACHATDPHGTRIPLPHRAQQGLYLWIKRSRMKSEFCAIGLLKDRVHATVRSCG